MIMFKLYFLVALSGLSYATSNEPFYRKDYTFVSEFQAFYKVHSAPSKWEDAILTCIDEGSKVFYPKTSSEYSVVKQLSKNDFTDILVGVHDNFNVGEYITLDDTGAPFSLGASYNSDLQCVVMNTETGEYSLDSCNTPRPFACKKINPLPPCKTIDNEYVYIKDVKKCYKIHGEQKNFTEAYKTCYMEGASMIVIKDASEYEIIKILINKRHESIPNGYKKYFMGVNRLHSHGDFYTVKGQSMYYNLYQPSNSCDNQMNIQQDCLSFGVDMSCYQAVYCVNELGFICEINADQ